MKKKKNNKQAFNETLVKRGHTTVIPGEFWAWPIGVVAKAVYCLLLDQADDYMLSVATIQKRLRVKSNHTIINAIAELENHNILTIEREQGYHNCYRFTDPKDWFEIPVEPKEAASSKKDNIPEPEPFRSILQKKIPGWSAHLAKKHKEPCFRELPPLIYVLRKEGITEDQIEIADLIDLCCSEFDRSFEDLETKIPLLIQKIYSMEDAV